MLDFLFNVLGVAVIDLIAGHYYHKQQEDKLARGRSALKIELDKIQKRLDHYSIIIVSEAYSEIKRNKG